MTWLYHVLGPHVMVRAVSVSRHPRFGTCYHLISRTVVLVANSSSRASRLGSLCKPTHKRCLWELCLSGALQILDLIDWLIECGKRTRHDMTETQPMHPRSPFQQSDTNMWGNTCIMILYCLFIFDVSKLLQLIHRCHLVWSSNMEYRIKCIKERKRISLESNSNIIQHENGCRSMMSAVNCFLHKSDATPQKHIGSYTNIIEVSHVIWHIFLSGIKSKKLKMKRMNKSIKQLHGNFKSYWQNDIRLVTGKCQLAVDLSWMLQSLQHQWGSLRQVMDLLWGWCRTVILM